MRNRVGKTGTWMMRAPWFILTVFPDPEEDTLAIVAFLKRLGGRVEKEFPEARSFVRPGFDEVPAIAPTATDISSQ
jgi:hypothetical protein